MDQEESLQEQISYKEKIEILFSKIDRTLRKWIWIYIALAIGAFLSLCTLSSSIIGGKYYLVAVTFGLLILFFLAIFSFSLYCQESFLSIGIATHNAIYQILAQESPEQPEKIAEECIRIGSLIKKRWRRLIPTHETRMGQLVYMPVSFFLSQWIWIPYFLLGEIFFHAAKECYIRILRENPKELQVHAALANTYVTLATHIKEAISMKDQLFFNGKFMPKSFFQRLQEKRAQACLRAIEELNILQSFCPDELWVLDQLAISYRELGMRDQEITVYNRILDLHPDDTNALFRVGLLSFQKGDNARGLELYDRLLYLQPLLAHELIAYFGAYDVEKFLPTL